MDMGRTGDPGIRRGRAGARETTAALATLTGEVIACRLCPRLVAWREAVAAEKRAAFASLHRVGLANQPVSVSRSDGLLLRDAYVAAVVRCAPPANRPTPAERDACLPYLAREIRLLPRLRVVVALGSFAWDGVFRTLEAAGQTVPRPRPRFGHGAEAAVGPFSVLGSFHPSQQNTFTGKLTAEMLDAALRRAVELAG